jgi:hypothetical protein
MLNRNATSFLLALTLATPGCFVAVDADRDHPYSQDPGVLTVAWLVKGSSKSAACKDFGAEYAYINVKQSDGREHTKTVRCDDFSADFDLSREKYVVSVALQDSSHHELASNELDANGVALVLFDLPADE